MLTVENNYPLALAAMRVANTLVAVPIADASCSTALATSLINRNGCSLILSETSSVSEVLRGAAAMVSPTDIDALSAEMERSTRRTDGERRQLFEKAESAVLGLADGLFVLNTDLPPKSHVAPRPRGEAATTPSGFDFHRRCLWHGRNLRARCVQDACKMRAR